MQKLITHTTNLIAAACQQHKLTHKPTVIVGLSGGPDSVFLLLLLNTLREQGTINLIAAHLNHEWRPDADNDVTFCQELCNRLTIPLIAATASQLNHPFKSNGSKEEFGRQLRRFFFESVRASHNADLIALAHHRQDQQETFFLRLIRGTTLTGLRGMDAIEGRYIRPLLLANKQTLVAYLETIKQPYLQDPTNTSDAYLRNRIRNYVIPALKQCDARFETSFDRTLEALTEEDLFLTQTAEQNFNQIFTFNQNNSRYIGNRTLFATLVPVLARRVVLHWLIIERVPFTPSAGFIHEILRFLATPTGGSHQIAPAAVITKQQQRFWVDTSR